MQDGPNRGSCITCNTHICCARYIAWAQRCISCCHPLLFPWYNAPMWATACCCCCYCCGHRDAGLRTYSWRAACAAPHSDAAAAAGPAGLPSITMLQPPQPFDAAAAAATLCCSRCSCRSHLMLQLLQPRYAAAAAPLAGSCMLPYSWKRWPQRRVTQLNVQPLASSTRQWRP